MKIKITFNEPLLGTLSGNDDIATEFILTKHPDGPQKDELTALRSVEEETEKSSTGFARNKEGEPVLWDYQIKGFFKEACEAMIDMGTFTQDELKKIRLTRYLYKKTIDKLIFAKPRQIKLNLSGKLTICERPLRGQTMRGERISLARSEEAPAETWIELEIITLNPKLDKYIEQWLTYGELHGLGQWRNSGKGRFSWEKC